MRKLSVVAFIVAVIVPRAGSGEEPVKFAHPGFEVTPRTLEPDVHQAPREISPPKPDAQRQGKPAQSDGPANHKVSSRPVKPSQADRSLSEQAKPHAAGRTADPASPREKPVPNDRSSMHEIAADKGTTVPSPAGRDISAQTIAPTTVGPTAVDAATIRSTSEAVDSSYRHDPRGRERHSRTPQERREWRERHGEGADRSSGDGQTISSSDPNDRRALTEEDIHRQIIANNERERRKTHHRHDRDLSDADRERWHHRDRWTDEERRAWLRDHPRRSWTPEEKRYWREHHQYFVPQFPGLNDPRRYRGRYSYFDRSRGVYYYPDYVAPVFVASSTYDPVSVHGNTYYYSNGTFYQTERDRFTEVPPPVGGMVGDLPAEFTELTIRGVVYSTYNGVYYRKIGGGYEVAQPPPGFDGVLIYRDKTVNGDEAVVIKIPDPNVEGQFIDVKLSRFGQGFRGPQGEWYTEFPALEQLKEKYIDQ